MQMREGGRFSLTALVIVASELFSLVLSAVRSPKHCLHTIKATKRDLPCPVNAIMYQHMHGLQVFQVTQCQETGVLLNGNTQVWARSSGFVGPKYVLV